jgi:hypothetical protein
MVTVYAEVVLSHPSRQGACKDASANKETRAQSLGRNLSCSRLTTGALGSNSDDAVAFGFCQCKAKTFLAHSESKQVIITVAGDTFYEPILRWFRSRWG